MKRVVLSQRVDVIASYGERRDALDQKWTEFVAACGATAFPVPNSGQSVTAMVESLQPHLVVLTGGNDLASYGGDAPERDETEAALLAFAVEKQIPLIGVCRGMQFIQYTYGVPLEAVDGHVTAEQVITLKGSQRTVNSYHNMGTRQTSPQLTVHGTTPDGVIKAVEHVSERIWGMMWHPERMTPFSAEDIAFFKARLGD